MRRARCPFDREAACVAPEIDLMILRIKGRRVAGGALTEAHDVQAQLAHREVRRPGAVLQEPRGERLPGVGPRLEEDRQLVRRARTPYLGRDRARDPGR